MTSFFSPSKKMMTSFMCLFCFCTFRIHFLFFYLKIAFMRPAFVAAFAKNVTLLRSPDPRAESTILLISCGTKWLTMDCWNLSPFGNIISSYWSGVTTTDEFEKFPRIPYTRLMIDTKRLLFFTCSNCFLNSFRAG